MGEFHSAYRMRCGGKVAILPTLRGLTRAAAANDGPSSTRQTMSDKGGHPRGAYLVSGDFYNIPETRRTSTAKSGPGRDAAGHKRGGKQTRLCDPKTYKIVSYALDPVLPVGTFTKENLKSGR